jgi:hypothetical protein
MGKLGLVTLISGLFLQVWLAALSLHRKIPKLFPMFFTYVAFSAGATVARLWAYSDYRVFYFVYWGTEAIAVVLITLALLEVFRWIFALFWQSWWYRGFLYGAILLVLGLAIANAVLNPPAHMHPIGAAIFSSGIVLNFMQLTIFAVFWLLSKHLQIGFRRYAFGIMIGFGVSSFGTLFAMVLRSGFGTNFTTVSAYIPPVAYILALGFWLHVFWRKEPPEAERSLPLTPEELAEQIRRYSELMKQYTKILKR